LGPETLALFVGFSFMVGVFLGCFGTGGSVLVTPALSVRTAVIATLKHHDVGQVGYKPGEWRHNTGARRCSVIRLRMGPTGRPAGRNE